MVRYNDPVQQLLTDIGQVKSEISYLNSQIARQMLIQQQAEEEMQRLEKRKEVFIVDLYDLEGDLNQILSDQAGC